MKPLVYPALIIGLLTAAVNAETVSYRATPNAMLEAGEKSGTYIIKLKAESVQLQGIRPYAADNTLPAAELLHTWDNIFETVSEVPALLTWARGSGENGVRIWVGRPSYDAQSGELRFVTRRAWKTTETLESLSIPKTSGPPVKSGDLPGMALYLDGGQGRVIRYSVGANAS